jgi:hypothetical protein
VPRFLISTTGEEAVALGAIHQVIQTVEQSLISPGLGASA